MFEYARNVKQIGYVKDSTIPVYELKERSAEEWNVIASGGAVNQLTKVTIEANGCSLSIKEYYGQRVVTLKDIDMVHQRPSGTADRNFRENKSRFVEGEDYFKLSKNLNHENRGLEIPNRGLTVFTQMGYLMLVKSFNDDLAWQIQRQLVNSYFMVQQQSEIQPQIPQQAQPESALSDRINWLIYLLEKQVKSSGADSVPLLPQPRQNADNYLTREEAAEYLKMSMSSIDRILAREDFPAKVKEYGHVLIDMKKLDQWLSEQKGSLTSRKKYSYDMTELKAKTMLSKSEAAFYIGICLKSLNNLIDKTNFYPLVRIGFGRGRVFVNREKLDRWIDEQDGSRKAIR